MVSLQANIRNMLFDQKSPQNPEVGVLGLHAGGGMVNEEKKLDKNTWIFLLKIVSSQANIRNTFFDQRSPRPSGVGVLQWYGQTDRQTHGHCDSMTESV